MRRSKEAAAETRRQVVKKAATEFRRNGIDSRGIASIMGTLGMTHGGFYRHFSSKEELASEAMEAAFRDLLDAVEERCRKGGDASLAGLVKQYLSMQHRDDFERACPLAAIGTELRRCDSHTRAVAEDGLARFVEIVKAQAGGGAQAIGIVSALVGGMMLARLATDAAAAARILRETRGFILDAVDRKG